MKRLLYQKNHGMPGIAMISGINGKDGTSGNNIYIGYINDFFDNSENIVDNLVRVASDIDSLFYYTGVYDSSLIPQEKYFPYDPSDNFNSSNIFRNITDTDVSDYRVYYGSYDSSVNSYSSNYIKVDFDKTGKPLPWNASINTLWLDGSIASVLNFKNSSVFLKSFTSDTSYPYVDSSIYYDNDVIIRPGKNVNRNSLGFDLFSIIENGKSYTFSNSDKSLRWDSPIYKNVSDGIESSIYNPSIEEVISLSQTEEIIPVDFLKTKSTVIDTIFVADHLSSRIKSGDIIYFYTDRTQFEVDNVIRYMVYITPELEGCDLTTLINAASIMNPFTFKYMVDANIDGEEYVYTMSKVVSGFYDDYTNDDYYSEDTSYIKIYGNNFTKLLSYMSDSALNLGILSDNSVNSENELMYMKSYINSAASANLTFEPSCYSDEVNENKIIVKSNFISSDSSLNIPLKIKNMYIKNDNVGNIESIDTIKPSHIFISQNGYAYTVTEDNYNSDTNVVLVTNEQILTDPNFKDFECGFNVVCYNKNNSDKSHNVNKTKFYSFSPSMRKSVVLKKEYGDDTVYDLLFWIRETNGVTLYSNHVIFLYNAAYSRYEIVSELTPEPVVNETEFIKFETSGVSADFNGNILTDIYISDEIKDVPLKLYINSTEIDLNNPLYNNSWYNVNDVSINDISDSDSNFKKKITISSSAKSNLPKMTPSSVVQNSTEMYIRYPGVLNSEVNGCDLFNNLLSSITSNTTERNVIITVVYEYNNHEYKSFFKLTQPGYTEKRRVPKVNLNLHKDIDFLEKANNVKNGVLSNQFQFFIDIDISDYSREYWGSYVQDSSITMDLEIKNSLYDYDTIKKYSILNALQMSSVHINNVSNLNEGAIDFEDSSNYIRIKTSLINNMISDMCESTQAELFDASVIDSSIVSNNNNEYIDLQSSNFNIENETLDSGIKEDTTISIRNIKFSDISDGRKFRICVNIEYGNPLFSKLFFKYYVSNLVVRYNYGIDTIKFYLGRNNLAQLQLTGTINYYDYLYQSNPLNVFVCPISYIATPNDFRSKNYCDENKTQIKMGVSKYVPEQYTISDVKENITIGEYLTNQERNKLISSQHVNWFDFNLYKCYFQDNIKSLNIQPIDVLNLRNVLSKDNLFYGDAFDDIDTVRPSKSYFSVIYANDALQDTIIEEDKKIFPYYIGDNPKVIDEWLYASRYAQLDNSAPIYTELNYSYEIREPKLSNSVRIWNKEFQQYGSYNSKLFDGHLSTYGNGYMFLDEVLDEGQYKDFDIYSLNETVTENSSVVLNEIDVKDFEEPNLLSLSQPLENRWYDSLLLQAQWRYPKYYQDNKNKEYIDAYDLIRCGMYKKSANKQFVIPYNIAYSIYPRVAYNYDYDNIIVFMLRCPSVTKENKYKFDQSDSRTGCYGDVQNEKQNVAK